jgi:hypothetical protein
MKKKMLSVRLHGEPVGVLEQTQTGKLKSLQKILIEF